MALLRRGSTSVTDEEPVESSPANETAYTPSKGHPTPKRSDARKTRRQPIPKNSKDAAKQRRERDRESRRTMRTALQTGDERNLPARDRGPARRLARDIVDSRFMLGQFALIMILVLFVFSNINDALIGLIVRVMLLLVTVVVLGQAWVVSGMAARRVTEVHGATAAHGVRSYAFWRSLSARRMRRPPPKVRRGDTV